MNEKSPNVNNRRTSVLMLILLILVGLYINKNMVMSTLYAQGWLEPKFKPTSYGEVDILKVEVDTEVRNEDYSRYYATIEYVSSGDRGTAMITVKATRSSTSTEKELFNHTSYPLEKGHHTFEVGLMNPRVALSSLQLTKNVAIKIFTMKEFENPEDRHQDFINNYEVSNHEQLIEWPDVKAMEEKKRLANTAIEDLYRESVRLIDQNRRQGFETARKTIEAIIIREPRFVPAYIELARIEMKTNWNQEGRRKAERHLDTALEIDPNSADAYVLIGYVYMYQGKNDEARLAYEAAERLGTENLWLWVNWGEMFALQGDIKNALEQYKKATDVKRPFNNYDRAQIDAYTKMLPHMRGEEYQGEVEQMLLKRMQEYETYPCFVSEYAMHLAKFSDKYSEAEKLAKNAVDHGCRRQVAQKAVGFINYFKWHLAEQNEKIESLSRARVFYPEGPELILDLIASIKGKRVLRSLIDDGKMGIDVKNAENYTALSLALFTADDSTAESLLAMEANPSLTVGYEELPISFIPILRDDVEMLNLMKKNGVNYREVLYSNLTAREFSDQVGSIEISKILPVGGGI